MTFLEGEELLWCPPPPPPRDRACLSDGSAPPQADKNTREDGAKNTPGLFLLGSLRQEVVVSCFLRLLGRHVPVQKVEGSQVGGGRSVTSSTPSISHVCGRSQGLGQGQGLDLGQGRGQGQGQAKAELPASSRAALESCDPGWPDHVTRRKDDDVTEGERAAAALRWSNTKSGEGPALGGTGSRTRLCT